MTLGSPSRIAVSHRRVPTGPWLVLGTAGTQAAAEGWVRRLMGRHPGQWAAGGVVFTYRPGSGLAVAGEVSR